MVQSDGKPDVSVPINWAYNHHYMAWMTGKYSDLVEVPTTEEDMWYWHGKVTYTVYTEPPTFCEIYHEDLRSEINNKLPQQRTPRWWLSSLQRPRYELIPRFQ